MLVASRSATGGLAWIRENVLMERVDEHWDRLPRAGLESPFLEVAQVPVALGDLV